MTVSHESDALTKKKTEFITYQHLFLFYDLSDLEQRLGTARVDLTNNSILLALKRMARLNCQGERSRHTTGDC